MPILEELTDAKIKRLRNLKLYQGKTDDEIREMLAASRLAKLRADDSYSSRFDKKFDLLKEEYAVDLNNSNDLEALQVLVRHLLQSEDIGFTIQKIQEQGSLDDDDIRRLKVLGEFQRDLTISISELQDRLGISRKLRKDKVTDDVPQFIDSILERAQKYFERVTVTVDCPRCQIELARYWLNLPKYTRRVSFEVECPQCRETLQYVK